MTDEVIESSKDSSFAQHAKAMGGYSEDDVYENESSFFSKYYYNFQLGRLENYNKFLERYLNKPDKILSIASGRSANELKLLKEGYDIVCSDIAAPRCLLATKKLFPDYQFNSLNILKESADSQFDGLFCLSLIYLFDEKDLNTFFSNISNSLKDNGYFILDSAGSPDNLMSYIIHDILLKYEMYLIRFLLGVKSFGMRKLGFTKQHFGYRRTDMDIIKIAKRNGFEYVLQNEYAFLTDFYRSQIFRALIKIPFIKKIFGIIGKATYIPYTRMFLFRKISD